VCDIVEAMSSHRPYRPAQGIEKALAEVVKNKGRFYDTEAVDACVKLFRESRFQFTEEAQAKRESAPDGI
jgi:HD-GYP domain-containing protein (c-di-GMP phosphodiesterase class II)